MKKTCQYRLPFLTMAVLSWVLFISGCSKPPVEVASVQFVDTLDGGSGNFDRMIQICFKEPLTAEYYHKIKVITHQSYKLDGGTPLRPLASDPGNKCHLRNLYNYIHRDSPLGARQMIKDYMVPGNINQVLIQIFNEKPQGKELPIDEKLFRNL